MLAGLWNGTHGTLFIQSAVNNNQIKMMDMIRRFLCRDTCKLIVRASVTSRLDICNSLLVGLSRSLVGKLQRCQNMAARVITLTQKHHHRTPVVKKLHCLPVVYRVDFKVLLMVYRALHGLAPRCVTGLIHYHRAGRGLRSAADRHMLQVPRTYNN